MRYVVYGELRVSYAVEVEAANPAAAEIIGIDEMPGSNLQGVDIAGDWEILSIRDPSGKEVQVPEE